jgi:hypothetical protein
VYRGSYKSGKYGGNLKLAGCKELAGATNRGMSYMYQSGRLEPHIKMRRKKDLEGLIFGKYVQQYRLRSIRRSVGCKNRERQRNTGICI